MGKYIILIVTVVTNITKTKELCYLFWVIIIIIIIFNKNVHMLNLYIPFGKHKQLTNLKFSTGERDY
jgi:hypothetical protein